MPFPLCRIIVVHLGDESCVQKRETQSLEYRSRMKYRRTAAKPSAFGLRRRNSRHAYVISASKAGKTVKPDPAHTLITVAKSGTEPQEVPVRTVPLEQRKIAVKVRCADPR